MAPLPLNKRILRLLLPSTFLFYGVLLRFWFFSVISVVMEIIAPLRIWFQSF